jgi:uncharacterized protein (TIGR02118 family)
MIKLVFCLKRLPHLSREAFLDYWLNTHGPLVRQHAAAMNVLRYVQHHNRDDPANELIRSVRGAPEPFDGVAELWWESKAAMEGAFSSPEGRAAGKALLEDEKKFIDLAQSPLWIGEENTIIGG